MNCNHCNHDCNSHDGDLPIDGSIRFESKVQKFKKMLSEIDVDTMSLRLRGYTLAACREDLDVLIECVAEERENSECAQHKCKLGKRYIAPDAPIMAFPFFKSGVVKIQMVTKMQCLQQRSMPSHVFAR